MLAPTSHSCAVKPTHPPALNREMISIVETERPTDGFSFVHYDDGSVVISCDGNAATLLRGDQAATFLAEVALDDVQAVAARWTTKYRPDVVFVGRTYPRSRPARHH